MTITYPTRRLFDHDEAFRRYNDGEKVADLAREYGVSEVSIYLAMQKLRNGESLVKRKAKTRYKKTKRCLDCDTLITHGATRCTPCNGITRITTVRASTLRCSDCKRWLPDNAYSLSARDRDNHRRGRRHICRKCDNKRGSTYLEKVNVPCERCGKPANPKRNSGPTYCKICSNQLRIVSPWEKLVFQTLDAQT